MDILDKIPEEERVEHLFLLVGTNPLPNYVAARLLAIPGGTVHLLHSPNTGVVAKRLDFALRRYEPSWRIEHHQIDNADGAKILTEVSTIATALPHDRSLPSVGLNYTGGTKAMSVHVYRALERIWPHAQFSYLDARSLTMQFAGAADTLTRVVHTALACQVTLEELTELHGIKHVKEKIDLSESGQARLRLCHALLAVHLDLDGFTQWREWLQHNQDFRLPDVITEPLLIPVIKVINDICNGQASQQALADALGKFPQIRSYAKWFNGEWLEEYVLSEIARIAQEVHIHDLGQSITELKSKRVLELDVAAMRGYQLFAISCIVSQEKAKCKEHLLEVYVRARQLGGDETKIALVCLYEKPQLLEREIKEGWFTEDKIRVFGPQHLPKLSEYLRIWFDTANKEPV
jgi:hypothetical protein